MTALQARKVQDIAVWINRLLLHGVLLDMILQAFSTMVKSPICPAPFLLLHACICLFHTSPSCQSFLPVVACTAINSTKMHRSIYRLYGLLLLLFFIVPACVALCNYRQACTAKERRACLAAAPAVAATPAHTVFEFPSVLLVN